MLIEKKKQKQENLKKCDKNVLKLKREVHLHLLKWILFNEAKLGSNRDLDVT